MTEPAPYSNGGYLPSTSEPTTVRIHPDECVIDLTATCQRPDHPTATSDCVTQGWIRRRQ